jgi:hypothetical protein
VTRFFNASCKLDLLRFDEEALCNLTLNQLKLLDAAKTPKEALDKIEQLQDPP